MVNKLSSDSHASASDYASLSTDAFLGISCRRQTIRLSRVMATTPSRASVYRWHRSLVPVNLTEDIHRQTLLICCFCKKRRIYFEIVAVRCGRRCAVNRILCFVVISVCWSTNANGVHSNNSVVIVKLLCCAEYDQTQDKLLAGE